MQSRGNGDGYGVSAAAGLWRRWRRFGSRVSAIVGVGVGVGVGGGGVFFAS